MIPKHAQFLDALKEKRKVRVQFYSQADSGVLDHVCAPMEYGPGSETNDGMNRYWLWDYASETGAYTLGLKPQQIVDLQILGEVFEPAQLTAGPAPAPVPPTGSLFPAPIIPSNVAPGIKP